MFCHISEHLSVHGDILGFEGTHKRAVRHTKRTNGSVDADIPESAEITLFLASMLERIVASVRKYLICFTLL
jgi:hypothetical protein